MIKCPCFGVKSWELGERTNLIYLVRLCLFSHSECFWPQASDLTSEPPFLHLLKEDSICNTWQRCEAEVRPRRKPSTECSLHYTPLLLAAAVVSLVTIYAVPTPCTRNFTPAITTVRGSPWFTEEETLVQSTWCLGVSQALCRWGSLPSSGMLCRGT